MPAYEAASSVTLDRNQKPDRSSMRESAVEQGKVRMTTDVTVVINCRDRYTGLGACIDELYRHTSQPFRLLVLDLGYPEAELVPVRSALEGRADAEIVRLGLMTPLRALRAIQKRVSTRAVMLLDNDSRVTAGWLPPLLAALDSGAAVAAPVTLEREGVDFGAPLRNHLFTGEFRLVEVEGRTLMIEHKAFRRALPEELPRTITPTETFEMHGVLFDGEVFRAIEFPNLVMREHLDLCMQLMAAGRRIVVVPESIVVFDNLGTRMTLSDMRYFFHRWSSRFAQRSARLFEQRWGYRFYSDQSTFNWIFRRKVFLLARWLGLPVGLANHTTSIAKRLFCRDWDPLPNADAVATPLRERGNPRQLSHVLD
jgi:GT2 family glycosyltransferase